MTVLSRRNRMISVRLSDEEYAALIRLRTVIGARSISDLARDAMRVFLNGAHRPELLDSQTDDFREQLVVLNRKIEELAERVASSGPKAKN
jgi:hypothetical protein